RKVEENATRGRLPEPAVHSDWAEIGVLRDGWRRDAVSLSVGYDRRNMPIELNSGNATILSGNWEFDVQVDGRELPFSAVAQIEREQGYNSIRRVDGSRAVTVSARVAADIIEPGEVVRLAQRDLLPEIMAAHPGVDISLTGGSREERLALDDILLGFILALFGIYALIAIPLRSYLQPLIIMGVIPFGIVGAIAGHMLLGISLSVISLLGIVALSGVVVNDSLIMVDFVNKEVQAGASEADAAVRSGSARLRPILLTSLTTFFGLAPMVFEQSLQAQMVIPMAVSLAFGILFATVITLILIPALYVILGDLRAIVGLQRVAA
ncbi:MAG: efflux RND transporter permease subunit, partial [Gammaproteobacteria bacterium]|nr:efflux RND transporter permease subunit [Gammaproteobacteria bacterium]